MAAIPATVTTTVLSLGYKSQRRNRRHGRGKGGRTIEEGQKHRKKNETERRKETAEKENSGGKTRGKKEKKKEGEPERRDGESIRKTEGGKKI